MTYEEAVNYIEDIPGYTRKTTLDHTERLLDTLGHPEEGLKIIHVAGTNGKGSTCAYLDAMLRKGGYRVGLFSSPHLYRITERYLIDGQEADEDCFVRAFLTVREAIRKNMDAGDVHPTYFEVLTLMAFLIFREKQVDYVILEVGMGGKNDVTNVIRHPLASIITSISIDHVEYLGDTIPKIAAHKAGIIKPGCPVIYDAHDPEAAAVIRETAAAVGSESHALNPEMYRKIRTERSGITFAFSEAASADSEILLQIPQVADYQMMNASLAFLTMCLLEKEHGIPKAVLAEGISDMNWPCRMETVMEDVIIDGAHNADGVAEFVSTVQHFHRDSKIVLLFSAVADKWYREMIRELQEGIHPDAVVVTKIGGYREISEEILADLFREAGCSQVFSDPSPEKALEKALELKEDGMLFCVGSLYLAGELKHYILHRGSR
ncbi:MAG: folylpolyglutamate synthase/dihydrofolate synthase family protein [Eubacteriales bacterium]|nr:folylpolyglutamate synthase/dihydrofolate synthase family protein [Eubacteriales bacterium]